MFSSQSFNRECDRLILELRTSEPGIVGDVALDELVLALVGGFIVEKGSGSGVRDAAAFVELYELEST